MIGRTLSHYKILSEISRGGMGIVYRAVDVKLDREVALKVLPPELVADPERKRRFVREAKAAAKLEHPHIGVVHEIDEVESVTFIAMELIRGKQLRDTIAKGSVPLRRTLDTAIDIAEGLTKAHDEGIVHRDLKPANIMVTDDGHTKIIDFGLAKLVEPLAGEGSDIETLTRSGETEPGKIMGTVSYMSPEQARGQNVDHRTDIFSFGIVLYEMLSGEPPFKAPSGAETLSAIINAPVPPLGASVENDAAPELQRIVDKCLAKDPNHRYQSAREARVDLEQLSAPVSVSTRKRKPAHASRWLWVAASFVAVVAVVFLLNVGGLRDRLVGEPGPRIHSIAVLPLENLSGDTEQEYFADGMTEALIANLAKIGSLKVISRTSAMRYKGTDKSLPQIAGELDVHGIVEGSILRAGDRVRITAQLIDAATDQHLWAETYERDLRDVLSMQVEVARSVAREVKIALTPKEKTRLASALQVNPGAYEAYLKGMSHLYKLTPPELDAALHYFEQALEIDPNYALAYTGISFVWTGRQQMGLAIPSEATPKAKDAVLRALALDNTLAEAHYSLAAIKTWNDWDWEGGEQAFKRALELKPNYPDALVYYSNLLCYMGRLDEALDKAERAVQLDPLNSIILTISGTSLSYLRRYDDAIERYQNALRTSPNDPVAHNGLWETYYIKGMYEESLKSAMAFFTGLGFAELAEVMAQGNEEDGFSGAMTSAAETMEAFSKQTYVSPYAIGMMYALAGDKERTIEWLEMGYEMKDPMMPYVSIFTFDLLDDDPRYQDLLQRMNLPEGN